MIETGSFLYINKYSSNLREKLLAKGRNQEHDEMERKKERKRKTLQNL